ncbi:sigma-70 family RNA polymerase sigma factor [bacterium]|nr:MAG: sigma-70 family RNA polymerase sigma factor [bacterium]
MMDVTLTESELLKGCVSGEKESWSLFVKQYNKLIYHTIYKTLRVNGQPTDPDDINDLFQEVFTSFCENNCKKLRAFDPQKGVKLSSWLRMITVRMTIDHLRKSKPVASLDALPVEPSQAGGQEGLLDEESLGLLREVVEQLSTKDKLLIELFYMKELPPEEIAQILKISVGALYTRKNRVLEKMRKIAEERKLL